jgi:hypothetical protein
LSRWGRGRRFEVLEDAGCAYAQRNRDKGDSADGAASQGVREECASRGRKSSACRTGSRTPSTRRPVVCRLSVPAPRLVSARAAVCALVATRAHRSPRSTVSLSDLIQLASKSSSATSTRANEPSGLAPAVSITPTHSRRVRAPPRRPTALRVPSCSPFLRLYRLDGWCARCPINALLSGEGSTGASPRHGHARRG